MSQLRKSSSAGGIELPQRTSFIESVSAATVSNAHIGCSLSTNICVQRSPEPWRSVRLLDCAFSLGLFSKRKENTAGRRVSSTGELLPRTVRIPYSVVPFVERAMTLRRRILLSVLLLCLCGTAVAQTSEQVNGGVPPKEIRVTLLGTASGPRVHPGLAGISTLVEAGGERFLFDAGRGLMLRLVQAGFAMSAVTKLFLTHLHSDHIVDVPDLMLTPWPAAPERKVPLEVWGPDGTRDMMRHLEEAFAFDIHMRRDVDESFSPDGIRVVAHDIREGKVYERNGVTVTAFLVTHGLVKPSYGYRVDYAGRSVALSGDTSPSDNLVAFCKGVDVLIHEAIDLDVLRQVGAEPATRGGDRGASHHAGAGGGHLQPSIAAAGRVLPQSGNRSNRRADKAVVLGTRGDGRGSDGYRHRRRSACETGAPQRYGRGSRPPRGLGTIVVQKTVEYPANRCITLPRG